MKKRNIVSAIATSMLITMSSMSFAESEGVTNLKAELKESMPWLEVIRIDESPIENFYFVDFDQGAAIISHDAKYLFTGELIDLKNEKSLTEERKAVFNKELLKDVADADLIVYKAENEKTFITVFTDPTCPYCQLMHNEIEALNELGVTVKYVMYPRGNEQGPGFEMVQAVMHAEDKMAALDSIKKNENIEGYEFDNKTDAEKSEVVTKISELYDLGNRVGVTGTPSIFLENGLHLPGYRESAELKTIIDEVVFGIKPEIEPE